MGEAKTVRVRPARDEQGNPKKVPKRRLGVLVSKDGEWPREAVKPEGEPLTLTRYVKDLLRSGDLVEVEASVVEKPATEEAGEKPARRRRKSEPEGE